MDYASHILSESELNYIISLYANNLNISNNFNGIQDIALPTDMLAAYRNEKGIHKIYYDRNKILNRIQKSCIDTKKINQCLLSLLFHELRHAYQNSLDNPNNALYQIYHTENLLRETNYEQFLQNHNHYCSEYNAKLMGHIYSTMLVNGTIGLDYVGDIIKQNLLYHIGDNYPTKEVYSPSVLRNSIVDLDYVDRFINGLPITRNEYKKIEEKKEKVLIHRLWQ